MVKGGRRSGSGRKPLKASVKRSVLMQFRCRSSEQRSYVRTAKARRMRLSDWIRATLTKASRASR